MEINAYTSALHNTSSTSTSKSSKSGNSSLGIDDFLKLLAAQLANQDMMNPSSDTEFIAQLAQFSSLQSMDSIAKMTTFNQSTALVGKTVVVATYDKNNKLVTDEGVVEKVNLFGSEPTIVVNGKSYTYSNVMEIKNTVVEEVKKAEEADKTEEDATDTTEEI